MKGLLVEIFKENESVLERTIKGREGRDDMTLYNQIAFVHLGGRFPVEISLNLPDSQYYSAGKYQFSPDSFKVGQYNRLEFDRYPTLLKIE